MPLVSIPAREALNNRRGAGATWGNRNSDNRLEPVALPQIAAPFRLEKGDAIFTIGSCFARHVEVELERIGFRLPIREMFSRPEFQDINWAVVNNYGVPSIFNELSWALDPATPFDMAANIVEVSAGRFTDLHTHAGERPRPFEEVARRRDTIIEVTRTVRDCRIVIMTLGLIELWFDEQQGIYLNSAPHPRIIERDAERFALHVMSFEETLSYMERAMALLRSHCREDQQVLISVSPVPMMSTLRSTDVMIANTYSKSCLRSVAEHICAGHDNVHYYPSYESVTLSDRKLAWLDDLVHVSPRMIELNVTRMIDAFSAEDEAVDATGAAIAGGNELVAIERARQAVLGDMNEGKAFFRRHAAQSESNPQFATMAVQFYLRCRMCEEAERHFAHCREDLNPQLYALQAAQILDMKGEYARIPELIRPTLDLGGAQPWLWRLLIESLVRSGRVEEARVAAFESTSVAHNPAQWSLAIFASAVARTDPERAAGAFEEAFALGETTWQDKALYAETLIRLGRGADAVRFLEEAPALNSQEQESKERLLAFARA